jgi:hypothetical protein
MKAYVITTGAIFGLITLAHVCRIFAEAGHPLTEPAFVLLTVLAAVLSIWSWRLLRRLPRS